MQNLTQYRSVLVVGSLLAVSVQSALAQYTLPWDERTNGKEVRAVFVSQQEVLQQCSAVLYDGLVHYGYAVVVSDDGYLLAKASELLKHKDVSVRIDEKKYTDVKVVATDPRWDVTLLKVNASGLQPVRWAENSALPQGSWLVANGATERKVRRINVGIVSAKSREIDGKAPTVLGVSFKSKKDALVVEEVTEKSGAAKAGIAVGDVILKVAGQPVQDRAGLIERLRDFMPGEKIELEYERGGKLQKVEVELMTQNAVYGEQKSRNDQMSGDYSERRDSFPRVIQTDFPFNSRNIGGPVLNLKGECVGMHIARANRAECFAIPVEELRALLEKLLKESAG